MIPCIRLMQFACALAFSTVWQLSSAAVVSGELAKWHPVEIDFIGPAASETDTSINPFLDYRLNVELIAPSGAVTTVPGFFAGDGRGNGSGRIWRARFSADEVGQWRYRASLRSGTDIAISLDSGAGNPVIVDGGEGTFVITPVSNDAPEFLRHGRLEYVGDHYLKFRDGPYWIKGGTDSPENLLGFSGIDGTYDHGGVEANFLHDYSAHRGDWNESDPLFTHATTGADSRGLIGALNYLGEKGVNSVYFLPMNLGGDGQETYPFVGAANNHFNKTHYDISKLHQWNLVLNHAQEQGIALNIVLSETETANEQWLDNGELGVERKLFFRELVARFGYLLAVKWNLGEENDFPRVELDKHSDYLQAIDWSAKPIAVHTHINQFYRYGEIVGDSRYSASSIQYDAEFAGQFVEQWRRNSRLAGRPWVIDMDENTNGLAPIDTAERRKEILYDVLFSGGNIEWYFGYNPLPIGGDVSAGDFRLREAMWDQMRFARQMMEAELPFWRMEPDDALLHGDNDSFGGGEVFAAHGEIYAVYLPASNGAEWLNLDNVDGNFQLRWFNPRTGNFTNGAVNLPANGRLSLGAAPEEQGEDWVVLVKRMDSTVIDTPDVETSPVAQKPSFTNIPTPSVQAGQNYSITLNAIDVDGTSPSVTAASLPSGMQLQGLGNGQLAIEWDVPVDAPASVSFELIAIRATDSSVRNSQTMTINVLGRPSEDPIANPVENITRPTASAAPIFRNTPGLVIQVGRTLVHRIEADDADGVPPALRVLNPPAGARFDDNGDGSRTFYWMPTEADIGLFTLTFIAVDSDNEALSDTLIVEVLVTR